MKTKFTKDDIPHGTPIELDLGDGLIAKIDCPYDDCGDAPWERDCSHGPVSEWTSRDKRPGERVLCSDRSQKRYYDFAEAVKIAKRDSWDSAPYHAAFPNETKGEQAVRAAEADYKLLRDWCEDRWCYIDVCVSLHDADGKEIASDSLGGIESYGDYWREVAAEMLSALAQAHVNELAERAFWESRDIATI